MLLVAYEWRRGLAPQPPDGPARAEAQAVTRLTDHLIAELDEAQFFFPDHKRDAMTANLRNLFRRAPLTDQDVRTLWGVIRALAEGPRRKD